MDLFEKVEKGLECCWPETEGMEACAECPYNAGVRPPECDQFTMMKDCLSLIRAQQTNIAELESMQTTTSEPHILNLDDQQKEWLSGMTAVQRLDLICQICSDWDGYRTATKLGDLINEIWTYANYPVKANTAQTARIMTLEEIGHADVGYIEGLNYVDPVLLLGVYSDGTVGAKFSDEDGECYLYIKDCGKTWRIWTQMPTDEQRRSTQWKS